MLEAGNSVRPGLHPEDSLQPWVFRQHQVWVDFLGNEHEIESMPREHAVQASRFCEERAARIQQLVLMNTIFLAIEVQMTEDVAPGLSSFIQDEINEIEATPPGDWLEQMPLMQALRRRIVFAAAPATRFAA